MNTDMVYKKKKALITAQIIGAVFGLILAIFGGYETFGEILGAIILGPVMFAALLRFCVRAYQFAKIKFGVKVQDESGSYVVIEKPGRGVFAAIIAFILPFALVTSFSQPLTTIIAIALIVIGAFFCALDIRYIINNRKKAD